MHNTCFSSLVSLQCLETHRCINTYTRADARPLVARMTTTEVGSADATVNSPHLGVAAAQALGSSLSPPRRAFRPRGASQSRRQSPGQAYLRIYGDDEMGGGVPVGVPVGGGVGVHGTAQTAASPGGRLSPDLEGAFAPGPAAAAISVSSGNARVSGSNPSRESGTVDELHGLL